MKKKKKKNRDPRNTFGKYSGKKFGKISSQPHPPTGSDTGSDTGSETRIVTGRYPPPTGSETGIGTRNSELQKSELRVTPPVNRQTENITFASRAVVKFVKSLNGWSQRITSIRTCPFMLMYVIAVQIVNTF